MSKFKYSDDEMDINKVLKMNQDLSTSLLNDSDLQATRNTADSNIDSSLALLRSLGKNKEILKMSTEIAEKGHDRPLEHRPQLETWEEIVKQANLHEPNPVVLEDIMTESEIESAKKKSSTAVGKGTMIIVKIAIITKTIVRLLLFITGAKIGARYGAMSCKIDCFLGIIFFILFVSKIS